MGKYRGDGIAAGVLSESGGGANAPGGRPLDARLPQPSNNEHNLTVMRNYRQIYKVMSTNIYISSMNYNFRCMAKCHQRRYSKRGLWKRLQRLFHVFKWRQFAIAHVQTYANIEQKL